MAWALEGAMSEGGGGRAASKVAGLGVGRYLTVPKVGRRPLPFVELAKDLQLLEHVLGG